MLFFKLLTLKILNPRRARKVHATPQEFFRNGRRTAGRIALKVFILYGASFAQLLKSFFLTGLCQGAEL